MKYECGVFVEICWKRERETVEDHSVSFTLPRDQGRPSTFNNLPLTNRTLIVEKSAMGMEKRSVGFEQSSDKKSKEVKIHIAGDTCDNLLMSFRSTLVLAHQLLQHQHFMR